MQRFSENKGGTAQVATKGAWDWEFDNGACRSISSPCPLRTGPRAASR